MREIHVGDRSMAMSFVQSFFCRLFIWRDRRAGFVMRVEVALNQRDTSPAKGRGGFFSAHIE